MDAKGFVCYNPGSRRGNPVAAIAARFAPPLPLPFVAGSFREGFGGYAGSLQFHWVRSNRKWKAGSEATIE